MKVIESINRGLTAAMQENNEVIFLGEDILDPYGGAFKASKGLSTQFQDRVVTTPISEAGIVGLAGGLALGGFRPVVEIMFGDFVMITADQILNHLTKYSWMYGDQVDVPVVIRTPMGGRRGYGPTHSQSLEKHLAGIPHLQVLALSHVHDPGQILQDAILKTRKPILVVENKTIYGKNLLESSGHDWKVRYISSPFPTTALTLGDFTASDLALITYGGMTELAMQAAYELMVEHEIVIEVLCLSSLRPLYLKDCEESIKRSRVVAILEEGTPFLGMGAEISCQLNENFGDLLQKCPIRISAGDFPIGNAPTLEDAVLPSTESIKKSLMGLFERKQI